jgi:lysophospholipase L1-like esterase
MSRSGLYFYFFILSIFMCEGTQAQDWANIERYREENSVIGSSSKSEERVVFMGNSITEGWKLVSPKFFSSRPYINRGISGQTTPQMLRRFSDDVISLKPAAVVIMAGVNDIAGSTDLSTLKRVEKNLVLMAEMARENSIRVILCSVLPVHDFPWYPNCNPDEEIPVLNSMIKSYAEKNGFIYLDYFSSMVDERNGLKNEYTYDGIHPNKAGYKIMEPLAEKAIATALDRAYK